eukprot:gene26803-24050_t
MLEEINREKLADPKLSEQEKLVHIAWNAALPDGGLLSGECVAAHLKKSGLSEGVLLWIWEKVKSDKSLKTQTDKRKMNRQEFVKAFSYAFECKSREDKGVGLAGLSTVEPKTAAAARVEAVAAAKVKAALEFEKKEEAERALEIAAAVARVKTAAAAAAAKLQAEKEEAERRAAQAITKYMS